MSRRASGVWLAVWLLSWICRAAEAQTPRPATPASPSVAFVNVAVIPMDRERVLPAQTVLVQGDRIVSVGPADAIGIPKGATVIDGTGRYLVPGLTDAHVHLAGDGTLTGSTRADFGDAPLYLAHGVTTVFNLAGTATTLEWRRRIAAGRMVGPTIYTSGAFVNEPRVTTPDDVQREITEQARDGYDLIKFHEIFTPGLGSSTSTGLSLASYTRLNAVARDLGMPLVGHAPVHLGLEALLQARQPLAHLGMLSNIYFLPMAANRGWLVTTAGAFAIMMVLVIASGAAALLRRQRHDRPRPSRRVSRVRALLALQLLTGALAVVCGSLVLPGGPLVGSVALRTAFSVLTVLMLPVATMLVMLAVGVWREPQSTPTARTHSALGASASLAFACAALVFWLPVAWRSSDRGIAWLASRVHDAGIPVQTTLVAYDAIGGPGKRRMAADTTIQYLREDVRARWRAFSGPGPAGYRYTDFMVKVAGALHRAGVPLMAATDAMGYPLIAPGSSLHREMTRLQAAGLSRYGVLRAATVVPAGFLRRENEFGTIAAGRRADLLLVDRNPLEDLAHLKDPIGVMARGTWYPRERLQQMLAALDR